jgi:hypothetical protein
MSSPAKRVDQMTAEERLQSLKDWAEEQKYTRPGEDGTLPAGPRGMLAMANGGPISYSRNENGQYRPPVGPPSYEKSMQSDPEKKQGPVKRWLEKRKERKNSRDWVEGDSAIVQQAGEKPPEYS